MTPATSAGAVKTATAKTAKASQPAAQGKAATRRASANQAAASSTAQPSVKKSQAAPKKKAPAGKVAASAATASGVRNSTRAPEKSSGRTARGTSAAPQRKTEAPHKAGGGLQADAAKKSMQAKKATVVADRTAAKENVTSSVTPAAVAAKDKVAPRQAAPKPASRTGAAAATKSAPHEARAPAGPYADDQKFLAEQRQLLGSERIVYQIQASDLKAEADSLAQEREPGDVQFDEESGEGGTVTVDRERDLALSAQALAAVEEIDAALARIEERSYGACERCQQPIPKPRLKALPYARLCVACKSGGLSRR